MAKYNLLKTGVKGSVQEMLIMLPTVTLGQTERCQWPRRKMRWENYLRSIEVGRASRALVQDNNMSPDPKTDEVDTISVEGTMKYLADLSINMENAEFLVPLEIVQAPALGEITKDGFVDGWKNING